MNRYSIARVSGPSDEVITRAEAKLHLKIDDQTADDALVDSLVLRARGFRTVASFDAWIIALCKDRKTIKCRGKYQQN